MEIEKVLKEYIKSSRASSMYNSNLHVLKDRNPDGYNGNLETWKLIILKLIDMKVFDHLTSVEVNNGSFIDKFTIVYENGVVYKLSNGIMDEVLNVLIREQSLVPISEFKKGSIKSKRVISSLLSKLTYFFDYNVGNRDGSLKKDALISIKNLEELSIDVLRYYESNYLKKQDYCDYIIDKADFYSVIKKKNLYQKITELDYELILIYLSRELEKIIIDDNIIKFNIINSDNNEETKIISESDKSIVELKITLNKIQAITDQLSIKIQDLKLEIKRNLDNNNKVKARRLFQILKKLTNNYDLQLNNYNNLDELLRNINNAKFNKELINTLTRNSAVLKDLNSEIDDLDDLNTIIADLNVEVNKTEEISDLLADNTNMEKEDQEIEKELQEMAKNTKETIEIDHSDDGIDELAKRLENLKTDNKVAENKEEEEEEKEVKADTDKQREKVAIHS